MKAVAEMTFTAPLTRQGSWGGYEVGRHESTMTLYLDQEDQTRGCIEWDIPSLDTGEEIGLWFGIGRDGRRHLEDYDGIFSLPKEAVELLRQQGIQVPSDFE